MRDAEVREKVAALDELLADLERLADPDAHGRATAAMQALTELYGEGFARILRHAAATAPQLLEALHRDELLSHLLILHDLHPLSVTIDRAVAVSGSVGTPLPLLSTGAGSAPPTSAAPTPSPAPSIGPAQSGAPDQERCELCAEPLPERHKHLVDVAERELLCACRACSLLFDRSAAGGGHYRLVPDRCERLDDFHLDDEAWAGLRIPVDMAFFLRHGESGAVTAFYPSPAGSTESLLQFDTWSEIEAANPALAAMEPDVEALLMNRVASAREHWIVGVDVCYRLVGIVRSHWQGFTGGDQCWQAVEDFFAELRDRAGTPIA